MFSSCTWAPVLPLVGDSPPATHWNSYVSAFPFSLAPHPISVNCPDCLLLSVRWQSGGPGRLCGWDLVTQPGSIRAETRTKFPSHAPQMLVLYPIDIPPSVAIEGQLQSSHTITVLFLLLCSWDGLAWFPGKTLISLNVNVMSVSVQNPRRSWR